MTEPGSIQTMTRKTAMTDEMPRYEEGCLTDRERALTSSETPETISEVTESRLSPDSSGIVCKLSRFSSSGASGDT